MQKWGAQQYTLVESFAGQSEFACHSFFTEKSALKHWMVAFFIRREDEDLCHFCVLEKSTFQKRFSVFFIQISRQDFVASKIALVLSTSTLRHWP